MIFLEIEQHKPRIGQAGVRLASLDRVARRNDPWNCESRFAPALLLSVFLCMTLCLDLPTNRDSAVSQKRMTLLRAVGCRSIHSTVRNQGCNLVKRRLAGQVCGPVPGRFLANTLFFTPSNNGSRLEYTTCTQIARHPPDPPSVRP